MKYDPSKVSPTDLLEIFFKMHDPTTKNRQGADVGTQYRWAGEDGVLFVRSVQRFFVVLLTKHSLLRIHVPAPPLGVYLCARCTSRLWSAHVLFCPQR